MPNCTRWKATRSTRKGTAKLEQSLVSKGAVKNEEEERVGEFGKARQEEYSLKMEKEGGNRGDKKESAWMDGAPE